MFAPPISYTSLPAGEQEQAREITQLLVMLQQYERHFASAVSLFDHCDIQKAVRGTFPDSRKVADKFNDWKHIAARDGGITLNNFVKSHGRIVALLRKCSVLSGLVDNDAISEAGKLFKKQFPRAEGVRHSVSHAAEFQFGNQIEEHKVRSGYESNHIQIAPGASVYIGSSLQGRRYIATFEGAVVEYEVSSESLRVIHDCVAAYYAAFARASDITRVMTLDRMKVRAKFPGPNPTG